MIEFNRDFLITRYGGMNDKIRKLDASKQKINKLDPTIFSGFTSLTILNLNDNKIDCIGEKLFENLSALKSLLLNSNKLKQIDSNAFIGLNNLENLYLNDNEIEEIEVATFDSLTNLVTLCLDFNEISRIDFDTFRGLSKLDILRLNNNKIAGIDYSAFNRLSELQQLYLDHNKLKRIDRLCFEPLKMTIKKITLYENDIKVRSFLKSETNRYEKLEDDEKLEENGFLLDWNLFLEQINLKSYQFHSPKLLIVDYYDSLINDIDIYTEELLETINENNDHVIQNVREVKHEIKNKSKLARKTLFFEFDSIFDPYSDQFKDDLENQQNNMIPKFTKILDYFNLVRSKVIKEVNRVKEENLQRYEDEKENYECNRINDYEKVEEMRSELFKDKYCFLTRFDNLSEKTKFKLVTVITDFYLDINDRIELYESLYRFFISNVELYKGNNLSCLLAKYIYEQFQLQMNGNEVISVSKETLCSIEQLKCIRIDHLPDEDVSGWQICDSRYFPRLKSLSIEQTKKSSLRHCLIDSRTLENLEYLYIEGMTIGEEAFNGLNKLIKLKLINCVMSETALSSLNSLQILIIHPLKFRISLEGLVNLKILILNDLYAFDLMQNLENNLIGLSISFFIDRNKANLFFERNDLSSVTHLKFSSNYFNPSWINGFRNLKKLALSSCSLNDNLDFLKSEIFCHLEYLDLSYNLIFEIKGGTFSQMNNLEYLDISKNNLYKLKKNKVKSKFSSKFLCSKSSTDENTTNIDVFHGLNSLKTLDISDNYLKLIDPNIFIDTPMLEHLKLNGNKCCKLIKEDYFCHLKHLKRIEFDNLNVLDS